jgi:hypothetical protein
VLFLECVLIGEEEGRKEGRMDGWMHGGGTTQVFNVVRNEKYKVD